ncbi:MAG: hypothetical protein KAS93_07740 [Gammaproteobacteria bacterium]|nr:hypothetical protein [Gammaproteobacteria bacterium]
MNKSLCALLAILFLVSTSSSFANNNCNLQIKNTTKNASLSYVYSNKIINVAPGAKKTIKYCCTSIPSFIVRFTNSKNNTIVESHFQIKEQAVTSVRSADGAVALSFPADFQKIYADGGCDCGCNPPGYQTVCSDTMCDCTKGCNPGRQCK